MAEYLDGVEADMVGSEKAVATGAAVMSNALTVFTIAGGPIERYWQ